MEGGSEKEARPGTSEAEDWVGARGGMPAVWQDPGEGDGISDGVSSEGMGLKGLAAEVAGPESQRR